MENIKIKRCFLVYYEIINYYLNILLNLIIFQIYFHNAILNTLFTFFKFFFGHVIWKKMEATSIGLPHSHYQGLWYLDIEWQYIMLLIVDA
jgi:hypothetical protein